MIPMLVNKLAQDPTRRIISVAWGGSDLLAIRWHLTSNVGFVPSFPFLKFAFDSDSFDVVTLDVAAAVPNAKVPKIVNPPSPEMLTALYMFTLGPAVRFDTPSIFKDIHVTDISIFQTLFINIGLIKSKLKGAKTLTVSASGPTTSGAWFGTPFVEDFSDTVFADTRFAAEAEILRQLQTLPEFVSLVTVSAFQAPPPFQNQWTMVGKYIRRPQITKIIDMRAAGYTYRSKDWKKGKFDLSLLLPTSNSPPLPHPTSSSNLELYGSPPWTQGQQHDFSFTINLSTLQFTDPHVYDGSVIG